MRNDQTHYSIQPPSIPPMAKDTLAQRWSCQCHLYSTARRHSGRSFSHRCAHFFQPFLSKISAAAELATSHVATSANVPQIFKAATQQNDRFKGKERGPERDMLMRKRQVKRTVGEGQPFSVFRTSRRGRRPGRPVST